MSRPWKGREPPRSETSDRHVDAVLFDLDGVLIDSIEIMRSAYRSAIEGMAAPDFSEFQSLLGWPLSDIAARLGLPPVFCERFRRVRDARMDQVRMQHGVSRMLGELRTAGLPVGIVTGKDGVNARRILSSLDQLDTLDVALGSDEVEEPKPSPGHAWQAIRILNTRKKLRLVPESILLIGDSEADVSCGRAAGCQVGFASWGYMSVKELTCTPDIVFASPDEVVASCDRQPSTATGSRIFEDTNRRYTVHSERVKF